MNEAAAWAFVLAFLGCITLALVSLIYVVWRLGEGMRSIIRFTPSIQLMESILNRPVLTVPQQPIQQPMDQQMQGPMGAFFPRDIGVDEVGRDKAPILTEEEIKDLLEQQRRGQ